MDKKPCPHKLKLNKTESIFGLKRVNAVVDCHFCGKRAISGKVMALDLFDRDFKPNGDVRTWWLKKEAYPDGI